jgi:hypothetical protein
MQLMDMWPCVVLSMSHQKWSWRLTVPVTSTHEQPCYLLRGDVPSPVDSVVMQLAHEVRLQCAWNCKVLATQGLAEPELVTKSALMLDNE